VDFGNYPRTDQLLLCDAQTSGGLLVALPEKDMENYLKELSGSSPYKAVVIGQFTQKGTGKITIR